MLNLKKIVGIIAMVAIIGFVFLGCEEASSDSVTPGQLKAPAASEAPAFTSADVASLSEAIALFNEFKNADYGVSSAILAAQAVELIKVPDFTNSNENLLKKSLSGSIKVSDSTLLAAAVGVPATIEENSKSSWKSNLTRAEYLLISLTGKVGDNYSTSGSLKRTVKIPTIATKGSIKFGGTVVIDKSGSGSAKIIAVSPIKYDRKSSGSTKYATAFTYDNGSKGAKFRFSVSNGSKGYSRVYGSEYGVVESDIEVFNKAGNYIFTIPALSVGGIDNFFEDFEDSNLN